MKLTNKAKVYFTAMAAAASFLYAAPVYAAPNANTNENKTAQTGLPANSLVGFGMSGNDTIDNTVTIKSGLVEKDGKTVYQDVFGQTVTGLVSDNGEQYYFGEDGSMETGWVKEGDSWLYFNEEDGTRETGEIVDGGNQYILNSDGTLTTGWVENNGVWNYYDESGALVKNTTRTIAGVSYQFGADGQWEKPAAAASAKETPEEYAQSTSDNLDRYQMIANAAIAQIGRMQDCTRLVTNSLAAVGIYHHGAPASYLALGDITSNPVPGDIIVYQGHVAIYIGNGRAIHGGWNGNTTVEWSVNCSTPFVAFVHPRLP